MKKICGALVFGSAMASGALSASDPQSDAPILWGTLHAGMTKEEVFAAQPSKIVTISDACSASLSYTYNHDKLTHVELISAKGSDADQCSVVVSKSLLAKYGEHSREEEKTVRGDCGYGKLASLCSALGGDKAVRYTAFRWSNPSVDITLITNSADSKWSVTYGYVPGVSTDTINKF